MKAFVADSVMGLIALDDEGRVVSYQLFPKDPEEVAKKLSRFQQGEVIGELEALLKALSQRGYTEFVFDNEAAAEAVRKSLGVNASYEPSHPARTKLLSDLEQLAVEMGFASSPEELASFMREVSIASSRLLVRVESERRDLLIAQAIQAIDDLDKTTNLFSNRIREWYGLHFPELNKLVERHETYLRLVEALGSRANFTVENLLEAGMPEKRAKAIAEAAQSSVGAHLEDEDIIPIQMLCSEVLKLYELREELAKYIEASVEEIAPNITALVGPLLGARLIALAGGIEKLARMPSSTIQVLGAEKALFRALRTGTKPPKHGIIFQFPIIHQAPRWRRGKIARALAGKLAIAARVDAFTRERVGERLREEFMERVKEINEKYKTPPPRAKPKKGMKRGRRSR